MTSSELFHRQLIIADIPGRGMGGLFKLWGTAGWRDCGGLDHWISHRIREQWSCSCFVLQHSVFICFLNFCMFLLTSCHRTLLFLYTFGSICLHPPRSNRRNWTTAWWNSPGSPLRPAWISSWQAFWSWHTEPTPRIRRQIEKKHLKNIWQWCNWWFPIILWWFYGFCMFLDAFWCFFLFLWWVLMCTTYDFWESFLSKKRTSRRQIDNQKAARLWVMFQSEKEAWPLPVTETAQAIWESKQVTAVELRFEQPGLFNVDGEILEHDGLLRLRVLPGMMEMLVQA